VTAFGISLVAMPAIIRIASIKMLTDPPDGERKFHKEVIPTLGGIGIFASFLISFSIWGNAASLESYPFFVASLFMLFLIGIKDDVLILSPIKKLIVQIVAAAEIVMGGGSVLANFGGVFGIYEIPYIAGVIISTLIFVILINSYNLIDGIDGLAAGTGIVVSGIAGPWFLASGFASMAILSFVLFGALLGFLIFNFYPAKIFMGDTGAMAVGFILAYIIVQFITFNQANPEAAMYVENPIVFAFALLIIPVADTLRVIVLRMLAGKNPLHADYNHMHHQFMKEGFLPSTASVAIWMGNLWVVFLAYYLNFLEPTTQLVLVLAAGFGIHPFCKLVYYLLLKLVPADYSRIIMKLRIGNI
jgi:UDP-N-acetylmuramyl pentapeptide phosphotransferase/UDP-N-acetylglucosamine-1-phosphate transferase